MNNLDLRQAIIARVHANTTAELKDVIEGSVGDDERTLPGLGVLFEMIWKQINAQEQDQLVQALHSHLQHVEVKQLTV